MDGNGFFAQIMPLLLMVGFLAVVQVVLVVIIAQRAAERRRRKAEGLENLPSFYTQGWRWLKKQFEPPTLAPVETSKPEPIAPVTPNVPLPDMDSLTDDLPAPVLSDLLEDIDFSAPEPPPPPKIVPPSLPPAVIVAPPPPPKAEPVRTKAASLATGITSKPIEPPPPPEVLAGMMDDAVEIMRVMRDLNSGKVVVDMRGEIFLHAEHLEDPKIRKRFENLVIELLQIAGEEHIRARFAPYFATAPEPVTPIMAPTPMQMPAPVAVKKAPEPAPEDMSLAGQIESYLQRKLAAHPHFLAQNIHIHPDAAGGVRIEVNGQFYEAVGDVTDGAVRTFLQATIQEWSELQ